MKDSISYLGISMGLRATAVAGTASVVLLANWRPVAASMRIKDSKSASERQALLVHTYTA